MVYTCLKSAVLYSYSLDVGRYQTCALFFELWLKLIKTVHLRSMEITFNTPAVLFPAISLLMLAYTNRFLALSSLIRKLHDEYQSGKDEKLLKLQIMGLKRRLNYVRWMQGLGVFSFLICVITMYCIYIEWGKLAQGMFAISLISLSASLVFSLIEIIQSTNALELELSDMQGLEDEGFFKDLWNKYKKK